MGVVVNKSSPVMVKPWEAVATAGSAIKLSFLDQVHLNIPVTSLIVFEHPISDAAATIQRALSQALVHYYPMAGRVAAGSDEIRCTGEGVVFVAASADCSLDQSELLKAEQPSAASPAGATSRALLDDLAVYVDPASGCGGGGPLVQVQVTEFSCGGFVLGVTWNHGIADTAGIAQYLQAVGEMARGVASPSVLPSRAWDDSLIPSLSPAFVSAVQQYMASHTGDPPLDLVFLDVTVRWSLISRIKAEYDSHGRSSPCTTFEAVVAVLWRCRTRAIIMTSQQPSSSPAVLSFAVNIRKHVGAVDGYYGNGIAATGQKVVSTVGAVANGGIVGIIEAIKDAKDGIPDMLRRVPSSNDDGSSLSPSPQQLVDRYSMFAVSSWGNLGLDRPDLGSGSPARVIRHAKPLATPQPFCMMCLPWKGNGGASVMSLYLKKEHVHAFLAELASLNT